MLMYEFECVDYYKQLYAKLLVAGTICISFSFLSLVFLVLTLLKLQFFQTATFNSVNA